MIKEDIRDKKAKEERAIIKCPECGYEKGLSLHITIQEASFRIPIEKGKPVPAYELLFEIPIESDLFFSDTPIELPPLAKYSDAKGTTRIVLFQNNMEILINCPMCKEVHALPKGTNIKCNVVS